MKRNLIIGVMMVALAAVAISCQKENMAKGTFTATMEKTANQGGKVAFDGTDFLWVVDDAITAVRQSSTANNSYAAGIYTANSVSSDNVATLGHLTDGGGADVTGDGYTGTFYAYSPASIYNEKTATTNSITLPATYYTDGNGNLIGAPMYAEANGQSRTLKFKNLCGMMCLKLATPGLNTYVTKIKITTDKKINGLFDITSFTNNHPTIEASEITDDAQKTVELTTFTNINTEHDFFIPLPQAEYTALNIKIYTADGGICNQTMTGGNHLHIQRSQYTLVDLVTNHTLLFKGRSYFTVSANPAKKVQFSQGNLQYLANEPSPGTGTNIWKFADNQYDHIFTTDMYSASTAGPVQSTYYNGNSISNVDLMGWGTNGKDNHYPNELRSNNASYGNATLPLSNSGHDWGFCTIANGGNSPNLWHTLSQNEWNHLFTNRSQAASKWARATITNTEPVINISGIVLLPDNWTCPNDITPTLNLTFGNNSTFESSSNAITLNTWKKLEASGAVFLPVTGYLYYTSTRPYWRIKETTTDGYYWSSSPAPMTSSGYVDAYCRHFNSLENTEATKPRCYGLAVRLVRVVTQAELQQ